MGNVYKWEINLIEYQFLKMYIYDLGNLNEIRDLKEDLYLLADEELYALFLMNNKEQLLNDKEPQYESLITKQQQQPQVKRRRGKNHRDTVRGSEYYYRRLSVPNLFNHDYARYPDLMFNS